MKVRYFAWLRERVGRDADDLDVPAAGDTVSDCIDRLCARDEVLAEAMTDRSIFKFALDARVVPPETPVTGYTVLAILPPMTGG